MKIIAYLRVSCDSQAESGLGLAAQEEACQKYASKLGTSLHTVYKDEGLSGALPFQKRPGMVAALSSLQKGDILLVQKLDSEKPFWMPSAIPVAAHGAQNDSARS